MNQEDLQKAPKMFCENIKLAFTPEYFVMGLSSGNQANIYSLTPAHTKRLLQYLGHELKKFEDLHGKIESEWHPHIVSPVQKFNPPPPES